MTVSPDFTPDHIAGWYIFNTWLQKKLEIPVHLELYNSFKEQRTAIEEDQIDLILANPFDATMLVRERGFVAVAAPENTADEAVIATSISSDIRTIEGLKEDTRIVRTDDPDINMMGMMMLEPADLSADNTSSDTVISYPVVAKNLLQGNADIGFFLHEAFDNLSGLIRNQLHEIIRSEIFVIRHVLLAGPKLQDQHTKMSEVLLTMPESEKGSNVLKSMGMTGWDVQTQEDTEFMIDLMDTLVD